MILAVIAGWLLYQGIAPGGMISYATDFSKPNFFIGKLTPQERLESSGLPEETGTQVIIGDPVYFSLRTLRKFDKAKLTIKYKRDKLTQPVIESGVLVDKTIWRYDLQPIENKIIDQLALVWDVRKDRGLMLLQKNNSASSTLYASVKEFLDKPPKSEEIALYNYDFKADFVLADYQAGSKSAKEASVSALPVPLRGDYQFYTYIKGEDLGFTFDFIDINKNKDRDPIDLNLYYGDQIIDTRQLEDDGIANDMGKESKIRQIKLKTSGLPEGVYKIELRANDDIITNKIATKQSKLAFINKIRLADGKARNISLFTDSSGISAETTNPGKLQKIAVGTKILDVNQTYKMFNLTADAGVKEIKLEKDDVILAGSGVFSFNKTALINPAIKKVDSKLDVSKINYVLAQYEPPREESGWKIAEAEIDLTKAYRENGKYSFLISIPGLNNDNGADDGLEIGAVNVELEGKTLWEKMINLIISNKQ